MNKIISTKTNAIFLATLLVLGTIATISPSFIIGEAQAVPYGMDSRYDDRKPYGMDDIYGYSDYQDDKDKKYDSYGPPVYGKDNSYDKKPVYGKDNSYDKKPVYGKDNSYDKKSYRDDNYEPREYQSYKPDYKPAYSSYEKDNKDKSKKDSVSINKVNCINNNVNINGNNTGDINVGNSGISATGPVTAGGSGYGGEGYSGYDTGHITKDRGLDCIINNNNTNNNIAGSGNQTTAKATLNVTKIVTCTYLIGGLTPETACGLIEEDITENQFLIEVTDDNPVPSQFPGSESGTIVTLGAGNYVVSETFNAASLEVEIELIEAELKRLAGGGGVRDYEITGPIVSFTGDCTAINLGSEATGTIAAGESQTCEIENHFDIGLAPLMDEICNNQIDDDLDGLVDDEDPDCSPPGGLTASNINTDVSAFDINTAGGLATSFSSPPTIAQGTTEEDLSALEKITKLKQQWLELLP